MRTLARILIILAAFGLVMGLTYAAVSALSSSTNAPAFERGEGVRPQFPNGERPEFPGGEGREFRGERRVLRWVFGFLKNIAIVGFVVALITIPKAWKRKQMAAARNQ